MNIKSKIEKYVHKSQNLSRDHKFAYPDNSNFRFKHMEHLRMSKRTRWSSQILQKMSNFVSRVHKTRKAKKEGIWLTRESKSKWRREECTSPKLH